ncbi:uncharacterized protein [Euphorbia lathyris]|uniref:uncharacterized protein n=1 Tax=Euphorbia lathyris TaxID=212925 RepID=UPI003313F450
MKSTERNIDILSSLPVDVALKIVSFLKVLDICALGSCSRFWRELCGSDSIWESLTRQRWPPIPYATDSSSPASPPIIEGWRRSYIRIQREMRGKASSLIRFVEHCSQSESLEFGDFNKAIVEVASMKLGLRDVQMFLFKPELSVLIYLVGLYHCIYCLNVLGEQVIDALMSCNISERKLCVKWWKLGRWFHGFRMRDESHSRTVTLADLLKEEGNEVLKVIRRGPIHEVLRVEFAIPNTASAPWPCQSSLRQDQLGLHN